MTTVKRENWLGHALKNLDNSIDEAIGMPSASYSSQEFYEREQRSVFHNRWCSIGFANDVPKPGDIHPVDFLGQALIIVHDEDNHIRVFHNFCPHRGTQLVKEACNKKLVVCPYHAWSFELNGSLRQAPGFKKCNKHNFGLKPVRTTIWNDVVFINFSGDAPDLETMISPLESRWKAHDFSILRPSASLIYEFSANWKLIVENFLECYHVPCVHPRLATYSKFADRYPILFADEFIGQGSNAYKPETIKAELPRWPHISGGSEFQAEYVMFFPNTLIGRMPDHVFIWTLNPVSPHETIERLQFYFIGDESMSDHLQTDREATLRRWKEVNDEDHDIVQRLHVGSRSQHFTGARFAATHEETIHQFHKLTLNESNDVPI